jgi:alanine dehydrogenase
MDIDRKTLIFNRSSFEHLLGMNDYIEAVALAHRLHAEGKTIETDLVHADAPQGEYHIKTGGILGKQSYYGLKANGGFFNNRASFGLPNILGIIYLSDAENAYPLAIFESSLISKMRTAAATAVAARYLLPKEPIQLAVIGYGTQAEAQIEALKCVCRIESILVAGRNEEKVAAFVERIKSKIEIPVKGVSIEDACRNSNAVVTTTPSKEFIVKKEWINEGTFIAAVGADSPGKNELDPEIFAGAKIVGDIKSQIIKVGETQNPIKASIISAEDIHAELGELVTGQKPGRSSEAEITIYDSTGTALQDIACAAYIYEKLKNNAEMLSIDLFK